MPPDFGDAHVVDFDFSVGEWKKEVVVAKERMNALVRRFILPKVEGKELIIPGASLTLQRKASYWLLRCLNHVALLVFDGESGLELFISEETHLSDILGTKCVRTKKEHVPWWRFRSMALEVKHHYNQLLARSQRFVHPSAQRSAPQNAFLPQHYTQKTLAA